MFGRQDPKVLVVGAGPVGLMAALALAQQGAGGDRRPRLADSSAHSYALALHARSLDLLDELGLRGKFLRRPTASARSACSIARAGGQSCCCPAKATRLRWRCCRKTPWKRCWKQLCTAWGWQSAGTTR